MSSPTSSDDLPAIPGCDTIIDLAYVLFYFTVAMQLLKKELFFPS